MDYGKIAYQKTIELEKIIDFNKNNEKNQSFNLNCIEFCDYSYNKQFNNSLVFETQVFSGSNNCSLCFQVKLKINQEISGNATISLIYNENEIYYENRVLGVGVNDVLLMKSVTYFGDDDKTLKVIINGGNEFSSTLVSYEIFIWNAVSALGSANMKFRIATYKQKVALCYALSGRLNYYETTISNLCETGIQKNNFTYVINATAYDVAYSRDENAESELYLFRIDSQKVLHYSKMSDARNEKVIENNVDHISCTTCGIKVLDSILISYVKNKKGYYRTLTSGILSIAKEFLVQNETVVSVSVSRGISDCNVALVTTKNGNVYIFTSLVEEFNNTFRENLQIEVDLKCSTIQRGADTLPVEIDFVYEEIATI